MTTVKLQIPDEVNLSQHDLSMILAAKLYEDGRLSAGQAAAMVSLTKRTFIELLGKYGVSVFSTDSEDLRSDIANA